jgi:hypothetical protein
MWDARIYSSAAFGLNYYISNPNRFGHPETASSADSIFYKAEFVNYMNDLINGEQIEWLYYPVPNILGAQDYLFISGPVYPIYLAVIFSLTPDNDFTVTRVINVFTDCFCLLLVLLIGRRLYGSTAAIIAGVGYALYPAFMIIIGMISPDPLTMLLTLSAFYMILQWYRYGKAGYLYLTGLFLGLAVLTRSTATLLFIIFIGALAYDYRKNIKTVISPMIKMALPLILIIIPWLVITTAYYGLPTLRDSKYSKANLRSSSLVASEGYDLDYVDDDFWTRKPLADLYERPLAYGRLLLKKFIRLWAQPFNDFNQVYILNKTMAGWLHTFIVMTGLFGIFRFIISDKKGEILVFLIPAYYTALHLVFHALARYNLNAMPEIIIASGAVITLSSKYLYHQYKDGENIKSLLPFIGSFLGIVFIFSYSPSLATIFPGGPAGVIMIAIIKIIILFSVAYYIMQILNRYYDLKKTIAFCAVPFIILIMVILNQNFARQNWDEWKYEMISRQQKAAAKIYIPQDFRLLPDDKIRLAVDLTSPRDENYPFLMAVGGRAGQFYINQPPISHSYYQKMSYDVYEHFLDIAKEEMRAWRFIPLPTEFFNKLADSLGYIEIVLGINSEQAIGNQLTLYGNYDNIYDNKTYIPGLKHHSVERLVEKGDPRIWSDYQLSSDSVISYYIEGNLAQNDDLSPAGGVQTGRYRIYLEVLRADGRRYYF